MQYDSLSEFYDIFNDNFHYTSYLDKVFSKFDLPKSGLALDCGCGTGSLLAELYKRGYDCTGVDASENMLATARIKLEQQGVNAHLICQDLENLDLYGAYHIVFCTLDTINHFTQIKSLKNFFRNLYNFIEPNGYFIFDFKTRKAFEKSCGITVSEHNDNMLIIEGAFSKRYASYQFTVFKQMPDGQYSRREDYVEERFYESTDIKKMLLDVGLTYIGRTQTAERIIFVVKKER
jgi:hypothetical protein